MQAAKEYNGSGGIAPFILNSAPRPSGLTTGGIARLGIEMDAGWASEQVGLFVIEKNFLFVTGIEIRVPSYPARNPVTKLTLRAAEIRMNALRN